MNNKLYILVVFSLLATVIAPFGNHAAASELLNDKVAYNYSDDEDDDAPEAVKAETLISAKVAAAEAAKGSANAKEIDTVEPSGTLPGMSDGYVIGPGDQIGVTVWREENLTKTVIVLHDGKISFPLIGEVVAGGKTVAQLQKELEKKLSRYTSDSAVTVEVRQSNSLIIYVVGRVNAPGRQLLLANTDVLQALAMVGGPTPFANKDKIKIFRKINGKTEMINFNYDDVTEGKHLETNIDLSRGDVIFVP